MRNRYGGVERLGSIPPRQRVKRHIFVHSLSTEVLSATFVPSGHGPSALVKGANLQRELLD
jgi:hypothetical protein